MRIFYTTILIVSCSFLTACSDTFLRAMDEFNAGMGGQRTCTKEAAYDTDRFDDFAYKTGGLCNIWQGQIFNYSQYTIKCENTIAGSRANTIYASPTETTELEQIGYMSGRLHFQCDKWAREAYIKESYPDRQYQLLIKMSSGDYYVTVKNTSHKTKQCFIQDKNERTLIESNVSPSGRLRWISLPRTEIYTNCY